MEKVIYEVPREYIEKVLERKLTDEQWLVVSREVIEDIEAVMYDTVLTMRYKWDELFQDN